VSRNEKAKLFLGERLSRMDRLGFYAKQGLHSIKGVSPLWCKREFTSRAACDQDIPLSLLSFYSHLEVRAVY